MKTCQMMLLAATLALVGCGEGRPVVSAGTVAVAAAADAFVPVKPADVANGTVLDEAVGIAWTRGYTTASRLGTRLARAGLIDKAGFKRLDQAGYDATVALRRAYLAGNATSYAAAINEAQRAVLAISGLIK